MRTEEKDQDTLGIRWRYRVIQRFSTMWKNEHGKALLLANVKFKKKKKQRKPPNNPILIL